MMQNENKNEEAQLLRLLRNAEESAKELEKLDEKLANVVDESGKLGNLEKNLAENQTAVESIDAQVRELNTQMELFNSKQQRKRRLEDQLRKLELLERVKCLEERLKETEWHGSAISELKTELTVVKQNLESPQYVSSKEQLKKEVVKKCVTTKATKDLATYIRVMDESVVKFHTEKMEEVNEILGALWEHVYHGSDIETIRIKYALHTLLF
ncbi:unnamed protein product [Gongylonema pulchrum]|uniref:GRIP domain-containing protein n=1 Tax=Gongylonema pulchrum TaxID=637853 RepID=A0A183EUG5_9BILA|nr:unnamed protein product [Gongylonema pulchrum]